MLPTTGDRVAAARPDRAGPTASDVIPAQRSPLRTFATEERPPLTAKAAGEPRGCLYALSQPPLMLFLLVIGGLLGLGASYDLLFL